jgi:hypothetical protein
MGNGKIFISYRREDTSGESGRLKDKLEQVFGKENIFYDVETLEAGLNFDESIAKAINESKVLLAMIGPHWLRVTDSNGVKRIQKEDDWVRKEISEALKRNLRVIPILVNGADMPDPEELPEDLKDLTLRHAQELTSSRWNYDVGELTKVLEKIIDKKPIPNPQLTPRPIPKPQAKSWWEKNYLWALGGIVGFLFLVGMCVPDESENNYQPDPIAQEDKQVSTLIDDPIQQDEITNPAPSQSDQSIYNELSLAPDITGKWWLKENGVRMGYFIITQEGNDFTFDYYYFDQFSGKGYGSYVASERAIYSEEFILNDTRNPAGFAFVTPDEGGSWSGIVQKYAIENNATLSREY